MPYVWGENGFVTFDPRTCDTAVFALAPSAPGGRYKEAGVNF